MDHEKQNVRHHGSCFLQESSGQRKKASQLRKTEIEDTVEKTHGQS